MELQRSREHLVHSESHAHYHSQLVEITRPRPDPTLSVSLQARGGLDQLEDCLRVSATFLRCVVALETLRDLLDQQLLLEPNQGHHESSVPARFDLRAALMHERIDHDILSADSVCLECLLPYLETTGVIECAVHVR